MEKGNAVDAVPVQAIESVGDRVTTFATSAVVDVTTDTAESLRSKLVDKVADAAIDEARERLDRQAGKDEFGPRRPDSD
ncbi:hypothetical protein [Tenggerimyces flavus]|uniref:Uncharacterized protein n=1 Tax=Tenggerimyces flavus TaxID=1708749 RepID=A0ABV7Y764_9ACTN|nr:hypothetical protein [Tenggerimyces flavus]MBM7785519.1 hypothetical protein [Tenggerimyces flavus]